MESNRSRQAQWSFGSVSFLSLSNFLPEPRTSVSASSHMQVHRERFVPSLMSNFMVLELEAGGGGWDSSWSHAFYQELGWCQIVAWWFLLYCSPPGFPLKSSAGVVGDQCRNSSDMGFCIPTASSLLGSTSNMENNDISGEEVGELSWASAPLGVWREHTWMQKAHCLSCLWLQCSGGMREQTTPGRCVITSLRCRADGAEMWWDTWSEKRYKMNWFKLSLVSAAFLKHNPSFLFEKNRVICKERDNLYIAQETEGRCCHMFIIYFHHSLPLGQACRS